VFPIRSARRRRSFPNPGNLTPEPSSISRSWAGVSVASHASSCSGDDGARPDR
jgi:hypothetical protein